MKQITHLPTGWFSPKDVETYRRLVSSLRQNDVMVELGSHRGRSIMSVIDLIHNHGIDARCIDLWVDTGIYAGSDHHAQFLKNVADKPVTWHRSDSVEAAWMFQEYSVSLAFIDTSHTYEHTLAELHAWWPKIKLGGWLAGHDYHKMGNCPGVPRALHEFFLPEAGLSSETNIWLIRKTRENWDLVAKPQELK